MTDTNDFFGTQKIGKILWKITPPVMLAQLIQALYNIVDSFFVGRYSADALTALTVIYPLQLVIIAFAVGTGVGVNTYMARELALNRKRQARDAAGTGMVLALVTWAVFAIVSLLIMKPYVRTSASAPGAIADAVTYGNIVCVGSLGAFLEGNWTKVHQAHGNMRLPMIAQIAGALTNIVLDPLLIFGIGPFPELGVAGAAYATVLGQWLTAVITGIRGFRRPPRLRLMWGYARRIYFFGYASIVMQLLYTVYIGALNMILASFSDAAVTVLGLYYKMQSFFFIPLFGLQTCMVPLISYNYARKNYSRCTGTMRIALWVSAVFMVLGLICFVGIPGQMASIFSDSEAVRKISLSAFPIIGSSFLPAVFSLMMPVFFQAIGSGGKSMFLSLLRQIFCLVPLFWLFSRLGLWESWIAFPVSEIIAGAVGMLLYYKEVRRWKLTPAK